MSNSTENPCFSCHFQRPVLDREPKKAACCHEPVLTMSALCYINHFQGRKGIGRVWFGDDEMYGQEVMVEIPENQPCIHLIEDGDQAGLCRIEVETGDKSQKPRVCQQVEPEKDYFCAKSPQGRLSEFLIPIENILQGNPLRKDL